MHTRQKIRDKVKQLLAAHPGLANCYTGRVQPTSTDKLPFVNIETAGETSERHSDQFSELRTVRVYVRLYASADEHLDDTLDALAETVESLLSLDQTLGGITESFEYKGADPDTASAANVEAGMLSLEYECKYVWSPVPAVDDFGTAIVEIDMSSPRNDPPAPTVPDGQIDAAARITLPS